MTSKPRFKIPAYLPAIIWVKKYFKAHVLQQQILIPFCQIEFMRSVAVDSVLLMQSRVRFAHLKFQFVSSFLCLIVEAITFGGSLGTCRAFMVTMLNCCRRELALSCSLCVGWHTRNLSSLAAANWHQEMGFWDTEEERGMQRGWERFFRGVGAGLSQHYGFRWVKIHGQTRVTQYSAAGYCCINVI